VCKVFDGEIERLLVCRVKRNMLFEDLTGMCIIVANLNKRKFSDLDNIHGLFIWANISIKT